jgi:2,4-dienoyl-CoA reductase-like NADH-dependent reductase (Old Yellow Enzyme family)
MTTFNQRGGQVTDELIQYHRARAEGGAAMTISEPLGMLAHHARLARVQVRDPATLDGLKRWAEAVESLDCRLLGQIQPSVRRTCRTT